MGQAHTTLRDLVVDFMGHHELKIEDCTVPCTDAIQPEAAAAAMIYTPAATMICAPVAVTIYAPAATMIYAPAAATIYAPAAATSGNNDIRTSGSNDIQTGGNTDIRTSGSNDIRTSGNNNIRGRKGQSFVSNRQRWKEGTFCASELAGIEPTPPAQEEQGMVFEVKSVAVHF
jgi:hypothetical protein